MDHRLLSRAAMEARTGVWGAVVLKAAFVVAALVVFAWVGKSLASDVVHRVTEIDAGTVHVVAELPPVPVVPITALPVVDAGPPPHVTADVRATADDPVYLNQASAEQLRRLPGCGPKRAEAIVELRARMGRFQRVEDLMRVKGIGRAAIRKWRPLVRLDAPGDAGAT